jgi:predicted nucleotidyltransferase
MTASEPEEARPATLDDLKGLITLFNKAGIDYLLIGGYALFAHGYQRATTDIDFLFPATLEVGVLVKNALMELPEGVAADIDPAWFAEGENIRVSDEFIVDIMFNACGETYETLSKYKETTDIDGIPVNTVTLEGLLLTKQTVRSKDISDRIVLERAIAQINKSRSQVKARTQKP